MPKFNTLPTSIIVKDDKNTNHWVCFECTKPIDKPYLEVQYGQKQQLYCSKCARSTIETILSILQFMSGETKRLLDEFPKKIKDKHGEINLTSTL